MFGRRSGGDQGAPRKPAPAPATAPKAPAREEGGALKATEKPVEVEHQTLNLDARRRRLDGQKTTMT